MASMRDPPRGPALQTSSYRRTTMNHTADGEEPWLALNDASPQVTTVRRS